MKNFGFIFIVFFSSILTMSASSTTTNSSNLKGPTLELQKELVQLIANIDVGAFKLKENISFTVDFIVNDEGEIVVLSTSSKMLDKTVKARLNYHHVDANVKKNHKYILPITIKK